MIPLKKCLHPIIFLAVILIYLCIANIGCKGDMGPSGPLLTGNIEGYATLYHEYDYYYANSSGIIVTLEGTSFSATTDSTGWWKLVNVQTGTYTLVFNKPGFFSMKIYGVQFVGGGTYYFDQNPILYELPSFNITSVHYSCDYFNFSISGNISSSSRFGRYIFVLIDTTRLVGFDNFSAWTNIYVYSDSISFYWSVPNTYVTYSHGSWIYLRCYPASYSCNVYLDPITRRKVPYCVKDQPTPIDSVYFP